MQNKNSTRFYVKKEIKTKQVYDKKMYPKLVLNKLKVIKNSTSIYTHWALDLRKLFKKLSIYICLPMGTNV
jgi:hypothetical protein